jgi:hypothetical protein
LGRPEATRDGIALRESRVRTGTVMERRRLSLRGGGVFVRAHIVQRWLHGSGGVARAHDSRVGTRLAVLAFVRPRRPTRQHVGQPRRTLVERRRLAGTFGWPTDDAAHASRTTSHRRGDHRDRLRAALPAAQSRDRPGQALRARRRGSCSRYCSPPGDQTHPGLEPSAPRRKRTAGGDETATKAADRRVAPQAGRHDCADYRTPCPTRTSFGQRGVPAA